MPNLDRGLFESFSTAAVRISTAIASALVTSYNQRVSGSPAASAARIRTSMLPASSWLARPVRMAPATARVRPAAHAVAIQPKLAPRRRSRRSKSHSHRRSGRAPPTTRTAPAPHYVRRPDPTPANAATGGDLSITPHALRRKPLEPTCIEKVRRFHQMNQDPSTPFIGRWTRL